MEATRAMLVEWLRQHDVEVLQEGRLRPFVSATVWKPGSQLPPDDVLAIAAPDNGAADNNWPRSLLIATDERPSAAPSGAVVCIGISAAEARELVEQLVYLLSSWDGRLTQAIWGGRGLDEIVLILHEWFGNPITITDGSLKMLAHTVEDESPSQLWKDSVEQGFISYGPVAAEEFHIQMEKISNARRPFVTHTPSIEHDFMIAPIRIGGRLAGQLTVMATNKPIAQGDIDVAEHASRMLSFELAKHADLFVGDDELVSSLLIDIISGELDDEQAIRQRMTTLHWKVQRNLWVLCVESPESGQHLPEALRQELSMLLPDKRSVWHHGTLIILLDSRGQRPLDRTRFAAIVSTLRRFNLKAGLSPRFTRMDETAKHLVYAHHALLAGLQHDPDLDIYDYQSYGFLRIRDLLEENGGIQSYLHPCIATLRESDISNGTDYFDTLRTYAGCAGDTQETLNRMNIHRSTLSYRLRRIQEITGIDLSDPDTFFDIQLSMRLLG